MSRRLLISGIILLATGCAAQSPTPLLWKVSDADNHVYLLGTFHLLKATDYPLDPRVYDALDDAEQVLLEVDPAPLDDGVAAAEMAVAGRRDDGRRLQDSLPPSTWTRLQTELGEHGLEAEALQDHDTWFVALVLAMAQMQRQGLDPALGLDRHLGQRATAGRKKIEGFETIAGQLALFEAMAPEIQIAQLEEALEAEQTAADIAVLHAQWRRGDAEGLHAGLAAQMRARHPALYQAINVDRNIAWLPRIEAVMAASDGDALVAVGSLHLLGDDGLVALLRRKGYVVERL